MSNIEWTEKTWNPLAGCSVVSPGCRNCYAMKDAHRLAGNPNPKVSGKYRGLTETAKGKPVWTGKVRLWEDHLTLPLRWKKPCRIFVNSMSDLFHEDVPDNWIDRIFAVMALAPHHTFQVLTKRPERMCEYCSDEQTPFRVARQIDAIQSLNNQGPEETCPVAGYPGYFASSHGFIFSEKRGLRRKISMDTGKQGHQRVRLYRDDGDPLGHKLLVHRIILETFVGPPPAPDAQGRHRDGNPSNNAVSNLRWGDQEANWDDSRRHGTHRRYSKLESWQVREIKERSEIARQNAEQIARVFDISATQVRNILTGKQWAVETPIEWPIQNCWLGTSVEDQARAAERLPDLWNTIAAVRFVSFEPLLGPVVIRDVSTAGVGAAAGNKLSDVLHWAIVGGESGPGARPMHPDWARSIRDQCVAAGVPFFFKQWGAHWPVSVDALHDGPGDLPAGEHPSGRFIDLMRCETFDGFLFERVGKKAAGRTLDGRTWDEYPG